MERDFLRSMFGPSKSEQVGLLAHDCCGVLAQVGPPLDNFQGYPALVELSTAHSIIIVHFDDSPQGFGHPDHALRQRRLEHCNDHTVRGFVSIFSAQIKWSLLLYGGSRASYTFGAPQLFNQSTEVKRTSHGEGTTL